MGKHRSLVIAIVGVVVMAFMFAMIFKGEQVGHGATGVAIDCWGWSNSIYYCNNPLTMPETSLGMQKCADIQNLCNKYCRLTLCHPNVLL